MIIFIHGEDRFRSFEYFDRLQDSFKKKYSVGQLNIHKYENDTIDISSIRQTLYGGGLFHNKNLVVISGIFANTKNKDVEKEIEDNFKSLDKSEDTILILREDGKLKKNTKLIKKLKELKNTREFSKITGQELITWIQKYTKQKDGKINNDAAVYLAEKYSQDLWRIKNEIDKLCAYSEGATIDLEIVKKLTAQTFEENVFALTDAVAAKRMDKAIYLLEEQWKSDQSPLAVFGSLIWQFQSMTLIKGGVERNQDANTIASQTKLHPFVVRKLYQSAKAFDWKKVKSLYKEIREIDDKLKTGRGNQKALLSLLVTKMCS